MAEDEQITRSVESTEGNLRWIRERRKKVFCTRTGRIGELAEAYLEKEFEQ